MIVLGIDQSYDCTGYAIAEDDKLMFCNSIDLSGFKSNKTKRMMIRGLVRLVVKKYKPELITIERVRMFSRGSINTKVIISLGSIVSAVIDAANLPIYSVDTRSWKARVVGSGNASKEDTIDFVKNNLGISKEIDDNAADAACIALYPFKDDVDDLMKKEN